MTSSQLRKAPPAALKGLSMPTTRALKSYDELSDADMKDLIRILGKYPSNPSADREKRYWANVKQEISALPSQLRCSGAHRCTFCLRISMAEDKDGRVKTGELCNRHHGLSHELMYDIWDWVRWEFDGAIGPFLYPIIVRAGLPSQQELRMRVLENVCKMWHKDFDIRDMAPDGREPLQPGNIGDGVYIDDFPYQYNECPACLLARIGSDQAVLEALYAGMVGRFSDKKLARKHTKPVSKRLRWVRYWLKQFDNGERAADKAWDFGMELKRVRAAYKTHVHRSTRFDFYGRKEKEAGGYPPEGVPSGRESDINFDISSLFSPYGAYDGEPSPFEDPARFSYEQTPTPSVRAASTRNSHYSSSIGVDLSEPFIPPSSRAHSTRHRAPSTILSHSTIDHPVDLSDPFTYCTDQPPSASSIYLNRSTMDHPVNPPRPPLVHSVFSIATSASGSSIGTEPLPIISPISESMGSVPSAKSRTHLHPYSSVGSHRAQFEYIWDSKAGPSRSSSICTAMPKPDRRSMYSGFGTATFDEKLYGKRESVVSRSMNKGTGKQDDRNTIASKSTRWGDLY
ncbi:hypothetical protein EJ04DRAFT_562569 [Polyplosphaeria fusca]|uniref:Uncharacterized protein n=1 Tax=Polyplosphaeria fusca TaxID=682080 RepID=A0A9P4R1D1_9PLEO|nr:hypothetical protein EJ04DRAFT_562569 [Polyplosphaeria fusca]